MRTLREALILYRRGLTKTVRVPMLLFFSLVQPMIFLLLFSQVFARLGEFPQFRAQGYDSYLMFFVPTVVAMTALTSAFQSGLGMVADIDSGMLDKFFISPIRRSSVLLGKVFSDATRICLQGIVVLVVAYAMGARVRTGMAGVVIMLLVSALFGVVWAALSNIVGLRTRNAEITMMVGVLLTFPLLFVSTGYMPQLLLPDWMETAARYNPITYVIDLNRQLMNFGHDWGQLAKTLGVVGLVGAFTLSGATRAFRRVMG